MVTQGHSGQQEPGLVGKKTQVHQVNVDSVSISTREARGQRVLEEWPWNWALKNRGALGTVEGIQTTVRARAKTWQNREAQKPCILAQQGLAQLGLMPYF